jgi:hypothetical protein
MHGTSPPYGPRLVRKFSPHEPETNRSALRGTNHDQIVAQLRSSSAWVRRALILHGLAATYSSGSCGRHRLLAP